MPYEHSLRSQKDKVSNARLAYNEKGGQNEPMQKYDDKVNECKDNMEPPERQESKRKSPLLNVYLRLQSSVYFFTFDWIYGVWLVGKSILEVAIPPLALAMPPVDRTVESNSCWKPCEVVSTSEAVVGLSGEVPGRAIPTSVDPGWPRGRESQSETSSLRLITGEGVSA